MPVDTRTKDFYLWHLRELGVISGSPYRSPIWENACSNTDKVKVALIDTGIDTAHPNLQGAVVAGQIDFTPHLYGARYSPPLPTLKRYLETRRRETGPPEDEMRALRNQICDELDNWSQRLGVNGDSLRDAASKGEKGEAKDGAFYKALTGIPGLSGYAKKGAKTPAVTEGLEMLPPADEPGMKILADIINGLGNDAIDDAIKAHWESLKSKKTIIIPGQDPSHYFGAHGTACAGLIGGRPSTSTSEPENPDSIAYYGVNPYCELMPICTPYSHEILPVLNALIYAVAHGAQVIHIPRGLPDYIDRASKMQDTHYQTRIDRPVGVEQIGLKPPHLAGLPDAIWRASELTDAETKAVRLSKLKSKTRAPRDATLPGILSDPKAPYDMLEADQADLFRLLLHSKMFEVLLAAISRQVFVVLSAGNDGWSNRLSYPARIHDPSKKRDRLVVVGSVNRGGYEAGKDWHEYISSYSNGRSGWPQLGIFHALSDDGFALDQERTAYDEAGRDAKDYSYEPHLPAVAKNNYSDWGLLTLDVQGSYGYAAGSRYDPPEYDKRHALGAQYAVFGGTSGASALAAGLISLWLQAGQSRSDIEQSLADFKQKPLRVP